MCVKSLHAPAVPVIGRRPDQACRKSSPGWMITPAIIEIGARASNLGAENGHLVLFYFDISLSGARR